ncbi:MAG: efflux transporter outer membrane subunit [Deltaproteobacteria bacterium]
MKPLLSLTKAMALPLGALMLASCATMAPEYSRPEAPVPASWPTGPAYRQQPAAQTIPAPMELPWRQFFLDPQLRQLIETALANNRNLRVAVLNIERYRAQYQIQRAAQWPQLDGNAAATRQRLPEQLSGTGSAMTVDQYSVGLGVSSYELDLFGRVRSLKKAALEQYLATREARRSAQISLIASVAGGYLNLAADREKLRLAQDTLMAQKATLEMIQKRVEAGIASQLDLQQARSQVEAARVDISRYTTLVAQDENALTLLVGAPLAPELLAPKLEDNLLAEGEISPGLSSEVLLQRPDVLQAEEQLKGLNANIGAARAAFFPRITLVGALGFGSSELSDLFRSGATAWNLGSHLTVPIFDAGANRANLEVAKADRDIAVAQYEKSIQTAFREVSDALAQHGTIAGQLAAQTALEESTAASLRLSQARFEKGIDNSLTVLVSQRAMYVAQQGVVDTRLTRLQNLVTLYKVLGGGANEADLLSEDSPQPPG